jgi:hypothetical protein
MRITVGPSLATTPGGPDRVRAAALANRPGRPGGHPVALAGRGLHSLIEIAASAISPGWPRRGLITRPRDGWHAAIQDALSGADPLVTGGGGAWAGGHDVDKAAPQVLKNRRPAPTPRSAMSRTRRWAPGPLAEPGHEATGGTEHRRSLPPSRRQPSMLGELVRAVLEHALESEHCPVPGQAGHRDANAHVRIRCRVPPAHGLHDHVILLGWYGQRPGERGRGTAGGPRECDPGPADRGGSARSPGTADSKTQRKPYARCAGRQQEADSPGQPGRCRRARRGPGRW